MEVLFLVMLWPLLVLTLGIVFISVNDLSGMFLLPAALVFLVVAFGMRDRFGLTGGVKSEKEELDEVRGGSIAFSIGLLIPIFIKYFLEAFKTSLLSFVICILLGFGVLVWGMFVKNYKIIKYANVIGGIISIVYLYSKLWSMGQLAQIIGSAAGLIIAVLVSVLKFKEKLV
jgi:hypothetical protein